MAKNYDIKRYEAWSFDDYYCLKPPVLLILSTLFLCRSFLLFFVIMATSLKGTTGNMGVLLPGGAHPTSLAITGVPAIFLLYALIRRTPRAGRAVRRIWKHGKMLLAASAIMEIATSVLFLYSSFEAPDDSHLPIVAMLIVDFYILLYVLLSKRVRDTFSDFPPELSQIESPSTPH